MKLRKIGKTGLEVTELSFGTSALGDMPDTYGYDVDDERARQTLQAIFAGPVNMLDTSRIYGFGKSEERIGAAIRERGGLPEGFVISTKLDRDVETGRFDAAQARRSLEQSLKALSLESVQLLHLHDPEHASDLAEITGEGGALDELFKMKEEGLTQAVGLAMGKIEMMFPILKDWPFDALINHNRYTLVNRAADEMYSWAHEAGVAIINAAPFASGVLAKGTAQSNRLVYQAADAAALEPVRAIEAVCVAHGVEPGAAALQFSMRDKRITTTLAGVSRPESVARDLAWAEATLPDELWQALAALPFATDDPEASRVYQPG